jgi:tRNA nucleotidyltransferase (CCA-adding enzyme)
MASLISQYLIDQYAAGSSSTRITAVKSLHENVRKALAEAADSQFDTFLQGSYRNNTAIADINDVDIVALYHPWTVFSHFDIRGETGRLRLTPRTVRHRPLNN